MPCEPPLPGGSPCWMVTSPHALICGGYVTGQAMSPFTREKWLRPAQRSSSLYGQGSAWTQPLLWARWLSWGGRGAHGLSAGTPSGQRTAEGHDQPVDDRHPHPSISWTVRVSALTQPRLVPTSVPSPGSWGESPGQSTATLHTRRRVSSGRGPSPALGLRGAQPRPHAPAPHRHRGCPPSLQDGPPFPSTGSWEGPGTQGGAAGAPGPVGGPAVEHPRWELSPPSRWGMRVWEGQSPGPMPLLGH